MTSKERLVAMLKGERADRVPFFPTIYVDHACVACEKRFEDALINPALAPDYMLAAALRYQSDAVRFCLGPAASWYEEKAVVERDGELLQVSRRTGETEGHYDVQGGGSLVPSASTHVVQTPAEVLSFPVMMAEEYLQRGCLKDVARCVQEAHRAGLFTVGMCGGQTINFMVEVMGNAEAALLLFHDDPPLAIKLITKAVAIAVEKARAFAQVGVDCIYIGDSYASGSVISPAIYRHFCAPAYREMAREVHRQGLFCYKHCCGNYNPLLDDLPSTGVDAMDGIDPTSGMSVKNTKDRIGTRIALMGGISCLTLLNGTPEAVYTEACQCVLDGKPGGRYALGTACAVPRATPPDNLATAYQAVIEHGKYQ